jgi:hypothetical protein
VAVAQLDLIARLERHAAAQAASSNHREHLPFRSDAASLPFISAPVKSRRRFDAPILPMR